MDRQKLSRRGFLGLSVAAVAGALAAACQPQTQTVEVEKEVTKVVEVEKEATVVVSKEPLLIRVHHRAGAECDDWSYYAQKFNDEHFPDIHIKMECIPGADYFKKLNTEAAGGTLADVVWISSIEGYYRMAATGVWAEVDELIQKAGLDLTKFYPATIDAAKLNGKLYGLPQLCHPGRAGLYYYKPLFDAAKVDYPTDAWTYDDLLAAAQKLTNEKDGVFGLMDPERSYFSVLIYLRAWGGDVINEDGTKCPIDSPEAVAGLQYISDLYHKYKVAPLPGSTTIGWTQLFAAKKLAMCQNGFWGVDIRNYVDKGTWGVVPMPIGPTKKRGSMFEMDPVCISSACKHKDVAFQFISTIVSPEAQMHFFEGSRGNPSPLLEVMESEAVQNDENMKVFAGVMADAMPLVLPANFRETEYFKYVTEGLDAVWLGVTTLQDAIAGVKEGAQAILDKPSLAEE